MRTDRGSPILGGRVPIYDLQDKPLDLHRGLPEDSTEAPARAKPGQRDDDRKEMQDHAEEGLRAAKQRALKIVWQRDRQRTLLPLEDHPDDFPSVMRSPPRDVLHPAHDNDDENAPPSRELATPKLTLVATRSCDRSESFHPEWLAEVWRGGRAEMRMLRIAPRLIKHTATLHVNTHRHTHHHHGPGVHHDHKDGEHHSHDAMDSEHHEHLCGWPRDDHPRDSSLSPLPRTESDPDSAGGTEVPLFSGKLRASSAVTVQGLLSVTTDDGDDINYIDNGADMSAVAAAVWDAEQPDKLTRSSSAPSPCNGGSVSEPGGIRHSPQLPNGRKCLGTYGG